MVTKNQSERDHELNHGVTFVDNGWVDRKVGNVLVHLLRLLILINYSHPITIAIYYYFQP